MKLLPDSRGGSSYMWSLAPGARLTVSTPGNHFELGRGRPQYLLLAGGIGITPIYSMALALAKSGADFRVLYACRRRQDLALADDLRAAIGDRLAAASSTTREPASTLRRNSRRWRPAARSMSAGRSACSRRRSARGRRRGRPMEQLRFETFGNSGRFATSAFEVKIPRLGLEIVVPADQSMLEALEAAGVAMISDCRKGECGLCALCHHRDRRHRGPSRRVLQR